MSIYEKIFDHAKEGIVITNRKGYIITVNTAFTNISGYSQEEVLGKRPSILKSGCHDFKFFVEMWARIHADGSWIGEIWNQRKNGELYPTWLQIYALRNDQIDISYYVGIFMDITERKKLEEHMRLFERLFENASEGIMITDTKGVIQFVNHSFSKTTGYSVEEALGKKPNLLHSGRQDKMFYVNMWASLHDTGKWQGEIWNRRKNGEIYPEWLSINTVLDESGNINNYVGTFTDITERKESEEHLFYLAHHDILTGLPNRYFFNECLNHALIQAKINHNIMAVLFLDLDRFKLINDSMGHSTGDQFLIYIANKLKKCVRKTDLLARLGGDEFTILITDVWDNRDIRQVSQKILDVLSEPILMGEQEFSISVSIGISIYPKDGDDVETLLKNADSAMYQAKANGKNRFYFYTPDLVKNNSRKSVIEQGLRKALERGEFELYYQPQFKIPEQKIVALEALIRWHHPIIGEISPNEFIPIAEENGVIVNIGKWVIWEACRQNKRWQDQGYEPMKIAVNLSVRQFQSKDLIETLQQILKVTGLPPCYLELEITESISMQHIESIVPIIQEIRGLGIEVSIDDFGTGYSSLSYLIQYPIHALKIDQAFIRQIHSNPNNGVILKGIVDIAHGLKLTVIAEGVEMKEELTFLIEQGCDMVQGYLLSKPLPPTEIEQMFLITGSVK
jgi:diguanylate cyclase (GGDEF)-like protein/PAS domain S-box-containing protein